MKSPVRTKNRVVLPGVTGTARVERRTAVLLPRLRPGDIAVLDHLDMDRATAQALVDAGVAAVVNASPMISGRYPNLGPEVLTRTPASCVLDRVEGIGAIEDGAAVRVHDEVVYVGETPVAMGREVDGRDHRGGDWPTPAAGWPPSSRRSPTTAPSSCAASRTCCCTACGLPTTGDPDRGPARSSWWSPATSTGPSWPRSRRSSASRTRC